MSLIRRFKIDHYAKNNDVQSLFDYVNAETDIINFSITVAGLPRNIPHNLECVPTYATQILKKGATGKGTLFAPIGPGYVWTDKQIWLDATSGGQYRIVIRK